MYTVEQTKTNEVDKLKENLKLLCTEKNHWYIQNWYKIFKFKL